MEQHTQYIDPEKNNPYLCTRYSLWVFPTIQGTKKKNLKKKRLSLGKEIDHLCPALSQPNSQHWPEAAPFPWRMLCNTEGRVVPCSLRVKQCKVLWYHYSQWLPSPCKFYNCLSVEKDQLQ